MPTSFTTATHLATGPAHKHSQVLRGEGFRDWGTHGMNVTCCNGTEIAQGRIAAAHLNIFRMLNTSGFGVDVFISTYRCTNGRDLTARLLPQWYAHHLQDIVIGDRFDIPTSSQRSTLLRGLALVANSGKHYGHLLVLRLDYLLQGLRTCLESRNRADILLLWGDQAPHASAPTGGSCAHTCAVMDRELGEAVISDHFFYVSGTQRTHLPMS